MTGTSLSLRRRMVELVGDRADYKLPTRVTTAIVEQENRGEILVKLIQILIVTIWGVLYAVSPKPDIDAIALAPYAIALYLGASIFGLIWASRRRLPDWAVYFSICFDMLLLYAVIWSFHIQYGQPASFYLKAPTLLYLFVFIALRAVRFQPRFVLAAGAAAALGWLAMIAYVMLADPQDAMITRNYVSYMTGNSILIGAEIDKIIAILMVTGALALSLSRGRDLLIRATAETAAAKSLARFFDTSIAEDIRSGESEIAAGEGMAREAAIFNVDIRGFSRLVEGIPPTDAIQMLSAYQRRVVPIIQAHGGVIDKFMGDGIMATFGAVRSSDSYAADALRAMEAIRQDAADWAGDPQLAALTGNGMGIAVSAGPIVFGAVGDAGRLEVTVIGATVNLSAKLEKANKTLGSEAVATRAAYDLAVRQDYVPVHQPKFVTTSIEGIENEVALAVWDRGDD
jgi:adenylate cyclase